MQLLNFTNNVGHTFVSILILLSIPFDKLPCPKEHFLKLLILGDLGVGKTSLVKKYCSSDSGPEYKVSVDVTHRWHLFAKVIS
jgi:hypothetical protein